VVDPRLIDRLYDPKIEWLTECKGVGKKLLDEGEEHKDNADGKMCVIKYTARLRELDTSID
jgi:hypothetical protein